MKSPSKQCVVCLDNPVKRVLVPCGHVCLCQTCSTEQGLAKLRRKCPECRSTISQAVSIYGRVVDD
jgi:E3 ubiquitin-protein ligase MUL1